MISCKMILLWLFAWFKNVWELVFLVDPVNPNLSIYGALQNFDYALDYKLITTIIALGLFAFAAIFKIGKWFKTNIYLLSTITIFGILMILFLGYLLLLNEENKFIEITFEYASLITIAIFGMLICLGIQAFTFYTLVSLKQKNIFSAEGALKYFLIGLLFDVLLISGLLFNIGAVPLHLWLPDAYQGAAFYVLIFLITFPKIVLFYLLFTLNNIFQPYLVVFFACIASAIIGSVKTVILPFSIIFNNLFFTSLILLSGINAFMSLMESIILYLIVFFYLLLRKFTPIIYHLFRRAFKNLPYLFCTVPILDSTEDLTSNFIFFSILSIPLVTYSFWKVFTMSRNTAAVEEPITAPNNPKVVQEPITAPNNHKVVEEPITAPNNHKVVDVVQVSQNSNAKEIYMERQKFDNYVNINTLPDCGYPKELSHAVLSKLETDCMIGFQEAKASGFIWCIDQCFRLDVPLTKSGYKYLMRWLHANDINTILEDNSYNYRNVLDHLTTYTELNFSWINLTHPNIVLDSYRRGTGNYNILDSEYAYYSLKDGVYPKTLSANVLSDIYKGITGLKRQEEFLERIGDLYYNQHIPLSVSGYYFLKDWYISNKIPFMPDNPIYDPLVDFLTNFADTFNL